MELYPPLLALALRTPGWRFHTVRGGIDPGPRFRPRFVGVDVRKDFLSGDGTLSPPGCAGSAGLYRLGDHLFRPRFVADVWKNL